MDAAIELKARASRGVEHSVADRINTRTWRTRSALRLYRKLEGFLEAGEKRAFERILPEIRKGRVLDLGVGGGRTAALTLRETANYVGIDYTPEMIAICREKYPLARFEVADARDLRRFGSGEFDVVTFSYNGIDAVDTAGRRRIMAEAWRVLRPGGVFFFSTFNQAGPGFHGERKALRTLHWPAGIAAKVRALTVFGLGLASGAWRRFLYHRMATRSADLHLHAAHDYGIVVYATTLKALRADVAASGFDAEPEMFGCSGAVIAGESARDDEEYFHVLARKPAARPGIMDTST